jgi:hypothetical protein
MSESRSAICIKLDPKTAQQLRAASQFLRGYPHLLTLQDICEAAIESHLDRLRGEHRHALKEHGGVFPESKKDKSK